MRRDLVSVVEVGYRLDGDEQTWIESVLRAIQPAFDEGFGVLAWSFKDRGRTRTKPVCIGCPPSFAEMLVQGIEQGHQFLESDLGADYENPPLYSSLHNRFAARSPRYLKMAERMSTVGIGDFVSLAAPEVDGSGVIISAPVRSILNAAPQTLLMWERVSAHLTAALRLRRETQRRADAERDPEAVVETDGRIAHARGPATHARAALRDAALAAESARGRLRREDPDRALGLWKGLVDARWSLVDRFDSDGRRYLVAVRNDPRAPRLAALTERERQVAALAAYGRSNKAIAYELGLSVNAIGGYLNAALRKLNVASRLELVRLYAALGDSREAETDDEEDQ